VDLEIKGLHDCVSIVGRAWLVAVWCISQGCTRDFEIKGLHDCVSIVGWAWLVAVWCISFAIS
jgi:predicted CDP-diglyceride synthetase/phosphatidate cytidylyltransferase